MAGNDSGIGNGFAPPASFERRPGMPSPTSSAKNPANDLNLEDDDAKIGSNRTRVENEDSTLHALPRAKNKKSYSFVTEDSVNEQVEENESEHKPAGDTQDED